MQGSDQVHVVSLGTCIVLLLQKIPRRILNLPAKLIFPAAPKLLGAQNARAYAVQKIKPYLIKVILIFETLCISFCCQHSDLENRASHCLLLYTLLAFLTYLASHPYLLSSRAS